MTVLKLIEQGGWVMIPLGILSVITLMFVIVFLFTLRPVATCFAAFYEYGGCPAQETGLCRLACHFQQHTTPCRVVQRTLDFATKNPGAEFQTIAEIAERKARHRRRRCKADRLSC